MSDSKAGVTILWSDSTCLSEETTGPDAVAAILSIAADFGPVISVKLYFDSWHPSRFSTDLRSQLQCSGVTLVDVAAEGREGASTKMILADAFVSAFENPSHVLLLVTADPDTLYGLSLLQARGCRTVVLCPPTSHPNLLRRALLPTPFLEQHWTDGSIRSSSPSSSLDNFPESQTIPQSPISPANDLRSFVGSHPIIPASPPSDTGVTVETQGRRQTPSVDGDIRSASQRSTFGRQRVVVDGTESPRAKSPISVNSGSGSSSNFVVVSPDKTPSQPNVRAGDPVQSGNQSLSKDSTASNSQIVGSPKRKPTDVAFIFVPASKPVLANSTIDNPVALASGGTSGSSSGGGTNTVPASVPTIPARYQVLVDHLRACLAMGQPSTPRETLLGQLKGRRPGFMIECGIDTGKKPVVKYLQDAHTAGIITSALGNPVLHPQYRI
ncbi:hypothetical protein FA15DRAFT_702887 [Coprinopsis marcescibilis]|uniref:NYN domain-containing protein n=1 Tax=Coprinopsis marcescibilis TaxID=230819 RepID=A0A5C3L0E1_COPMA|nr:hypothetical protein FA15DRAFT_702887 [Coprinopsis marcescibilis]